MLDLFNIATPQGCDVRIFYGSQGESTVIKNSWTKPRGVSNVYMLLIGGGGNGNGTTGGGSGAVTVWYGSAQNVPDILFPIPGRGENSGIDTNTKVGYKGSSGTIVALLTAASGSGGGGAGAAMTANQFAASGFFQSIAGQAGSTSAVTAATTTFLGAGGNNTSQQDSNYGYSLGTFANPSGFFQTQPIIVGGGGMGSGRGGVGCGGGRSTGLGGPGLVLIASW